MPQLPQGPGFDLADASARYCERLPDRLPGAPNNLSLQSKVRGYDADEFAGCDSLDQLPEFWKVPPVACDEGVGAGGVRAF
jgi:hypothetical protein